MNAALPAEMVEATRLTRAGQLTEATALLQRVLRGGTVPDTSPPGDTAPAGGGVRVVELTPDTSELTERPLMPPAAQPAAASATGRSAGTRERSQPPAPPRRLLARVGRGPAEPAIGGPLARRPPRTADLLPDGGRFLAAAHRNQAGSRDYKLYVPSGYCGQAVPLVVMLHGCTQSPDDFAAGTRMNLLAEERTCLVAYPAQATAANPSRCWNWYSPGHQQRGRGEPSLLAGITRQILRDYAVDPARA